MSCRLKPVPDFRARCTKIIRFQGKTHKNYKKKKQTKTKNKQTKQNKPNPSLGSMHSKADFYFYCKYYLTPWSETHPLLCVLFGSLDTVYKQTGLTILVVIAIVNYIRLSHKRQYCIMFCTIKILSIQALSMNICLLL